jgi:isopenicillin-N epimerase
MCAVVLDPAIRFLNHGSFGACPEEVLEAQSEYRRRLESEPVRFFVRELEPLLDDAREQLGEFLKADAESLAFVPNATYGVNAVIRSLTVEAGDELLTTNHAYNACRNALEYVAERTGARIVVASIPIPIANESSIVEAIIPLVTPQTKLALLDHVTSQTAVIFPLKRIVEQLRARGVRSLIDGAHAPGMIELNLEELGADYYTGNCHKWMCAPKGAAFLWVRRDLQGEVRPAVISHGTRGSRKNRSRFRQEFDWTGTQDPSAYLCIPDAIRFLTNSHRWGIVGRMNANRQQCLSARASLVKEIGAAGVAPEEMIGSMATVILPQFDWGCDMVGELHPLQEHLFQEFKIEVPISIWPDNRVLLRISSQFYNRQEDYDALITSLRSFMARRA